MDWKDWSSLLAGTIALLAYIPYIRSVLRGSARPRKSSWAVWASADLLLITSMAADGMWKGQMIGLAAGSVITFALVLKRGEPGWKTIDIASMTCGMLGLALWMVLGDPVLALIANLIGITIGTIPTYVQVYHHPEDEDGLSWVLFFDSSVLVILAIRQWTITDALQPIHFGIGQLPILYMIFVRGRKHPQPALDRTLPSA